MDSVDLDVLKACVAWRAEGRGVNLLTVVRTWGSAPRPIGAMLALRDDGQVAGSVSGGCIEDDLIEHVRRQGLHTGTPDTLRYGVNAEEARRFGLPCGGTIALVREALGEHSAIEALLAAVERGERVTRTLDLASGRAQIAPAVADAALGFDGCTLIACHGPRYRLLVIGAGQLSRFLCEMALALDFQVTVCDPRDEYADTWHLPGATLLRTAPDDAVLALRPDAHSAVVALTHDPKLDDLALMEALKSEAFYVGALGSRANNDKRRERLLELELSAVEVARLHGPIGLYIGSRTPPEIAVSIAAELIATRNGVSLPEIARVAAAKAQQGASGGCAA